jgi:arabinose-5-phosphate isomerase
MTRADSFLATARRVIDVEADALARLSAALDDTFTQAVELILAAEGRVIVLGMGKSGHIARKIAATFASTGTPAHFVHPAEASHGDLGMMGRGDVAMVLSNSGETPELSDVIAYSRRFGIPLIGVARRPESTLLRQSDVAICLPEAPEACGQGIVPTTSTTMTLALGDAMALALMEHRAFTPENFRAFHPGGSLGARLSAVRDLMHTGAELPLLPETAPMSEALVEMSAKGFGVLGATGTAGNLTGIVTDGDLRRHLEGLMEHTVAEVMTHRPLTIRPDVLAEEALAVMNARRVTCLFVTETEGGAPLGLLHVHDCLRAGLG